MDATPLSGQVALVTGARGFIGRHLVARLTTLGVRVVALARDSERPPEWPTGVRLVTGDVRDATAVKDAANGVDAVFHLAGRVHALRETGEDGEHAAVNVEGTRRVLQAAVTAGAGRFVFFSSVKAMGEEASDGPDEGAEPRPETPYGRSKLAAERLVLDCGQQTGMHVVCLRLPLVYGPGNKGNLYRMIAAVDRGWFPPLQRVDNRRSMVHVSNVVEASMVAAQAVGHGGQCYIVTDARSYSTGEIYRLICEGLGRPVPRWSCPPWVLRVLARTGDLMATVSGRRGPFDSDALAKLVGSAWYRADAITRELGFRPERTLDEALPALIAWYRQQRAPR